MSKDLIKKSLEEIRCNEKDTGSIEVQIVKLTERISDLTSRSKQHPKDFTSKRSLLKLVGRRHRFLKYLKRVKPETHKDVEGCLNRLREAA